MDDLSLIDVIENIKDDLEDHDTGCYETMISLLRKYNYFIQDIAQETDGLVGNVWKNRVDKKRIINSPERSEFFRITQHYAENGYDWNIDYGNGLPLIVAMETFDEELVALFLKHKADPNQFGIQENMNGLAFAVILDSSELTELLLSYGANVNSPCCNGITPLQLSVNKSEEISKILFKYGASPQQVMSVRPDSSVHLSDKPLFTVMKSKNRYLMSVMLEHGEDVDQLISDRLESPIHFAVRDGDEETVKLLVHHGANLNKRNQDGVTPLGLSLIGENKENIAKILLQAGASPIRESFMPDCFDFYDGNVSSRIPPLHISAHYGYLHAVKFIVERKWDPISTMNCSSHSCQSYSESTNPFEEENSVERKFIPYRDSQESTCCIPKTCNTDTENNPCIMNVNLKCTLGTTPLFHAFLGGHCSVIDYLLSKGANPAVQCSEGNLIHAAIDCYNSTTINLLNLAIHFDCDINLVNSFGYSPLLSASRYQNPDILELLLAHGADLNTQDKNGETALMCSVYFGGEENAQVLISHGAELNTTDNRGTTALYWSIYNCREKTLRLLIEAGAKFNLRELFKYPRNLKVMRNEDLRRWLHSQLSSPLDLQHLCRLSIRQTLVTLSDGKSIMKRINGLPLPDKIKQYISLK